LFGTHSLRRTKATLIYRRTGDLRAVQLLLGHTKIESTLRYLGITGCVHVRGIAVHIASRVAHLGAADDVLVSRTVKDLVAGSGIKFADFGTHALRGIPDEWQIFRAIG
jgi:Phage integrase family